MDAQQPIDVAAGQFDRSGVAERAAKAEAERQALVQRFPLDAWPEMSLAEYALGQEKSEDIVVALPTFPRERRGITVA